MPALTAVDPETGGQLQQGFLDRWISHVASGQHGVIARRQLTAIGAGRRAIDHRVERRRLHVVHRGVYAVGHPNLGENGRRMAAVLATGPRAVLSHRAAAALWGVLRSERLEVSDPLSRRARPGFTVHRLRLAADEVTALAGIPVTTLPRTLFDLAAVLRRDQVERAVNDAELRGITDPLSLAGLVERHRRRHGVPVMREILAELTSGAALTRSELESRFRAFLRRAGLPRPELNASLRLSGRWLECDCVWRAERLVVELDGRAAHSTAAAFERDRMRDRVLTAGGWRVMRVTWRQLHDEPEALAADLAKTLTSGKKDT